MARTTKPLTNTEVKQVAVSVEYSEDLKLTKRLRAIEATIRRKEKGAVRCRTQQFQKIQ